MPVWFPFIQTVVNVSLGDRPDDVCTVLYTDLLMYTNMIYTVHKRKYL